MAVKAKSFSVVPHVKFFFPEPLLDPLRWESNLHRDVSPSRVTTALPLDLATSVGGPLKQEIERLARTNSSVWYLPHDFLFGPSVGRHVSVRTIRETEIASQLRLTNAEIVYTDRLPTSAEKANSVLNNVSLELLKGAPTIESWAELLFPTAAREPDFNEALGAYLREFPEAAEFAWEGFRFFSGFVRKRAGSRLSSLIAVDGASAQAFYNPNDERSEESALETEQLIVNPTLQIVKPGASEDVNKIRFYFRIEGVLKHLAIGWREAFLVDEVSEAPRITSSQLLAVATREAAGSEITLKDFSGDQPDFPSALRHLVSAGALLQGR